MKTQILSVNLGSRNIHIPVFQLKSVSKGNNILITAGVDGDEYAGIEAAFQLARVLEDKVIFGEVTIIPIVNIPGFEAGTSSCPLDGKYPKNFFLGKEGGCESERLIYCLSQKYILNSHVWIDLHGGALDEALTPFLYMFKTGNIKLDDINSRIINISPFNRVVYASSSSWSKVDNLTKKDITYILLEAGQLGERKKKWIDLHLIGVRSILGEIGTIIYKNKKRNHQIFHQLQIIKSPKEGLWYPEVDVRDEIDKGRKIGEIKSFENKVTRTMSAVQNGICLWIKKGMYIKKGDTLAGIGYQFIQ